MQTQSPPPLVHTRSGYFPLHQLVWHKPQQYPFILESTQGFDILMAFPQATLRKHVDNTVQWQGQDLAASSFLTALNETWQNQQIQSYTALDLPFTGGWFIYLGYELAGEIEPRLIQPQQQSNLPVAQATRIPAAIIYDHQRDLTHIVVESNFAHLLDVLREDIESLVNQGESRLRYDKISTVEDVAEEYLCATNKVLDYIRAGDVFQVNLSRAWRGTLQDKSVLSTIHQRLRITNPAPFGGLAQFENGAIISSSPERLVRVRNGIIETRPIAGTRPRSSTKTRDDDLRQELLINAKERAEHIMLIDLERNDLGRICETGSVEVDELMVLESYSHVHHIVSNIKGKLRAGVLPGDVIRAVFPGGTITGCPKVRCMEIIAELEATPRGPYTGSFGYLNHNGDMDLNILIRSIVMDGNQLTIRAGAGLVADSDPQRELDETRAKAKGMLLALETA